MFVCEPVECFIDHRHQLLANFYIRLEMIFFTMTFSKEEN